MARPAHHHIHASHAHLRRGVILNSEFLGHPKGRLLPATLNSELLLRSLEPHANTTPEVVVVRDVVGVVEEPAPLTEEIHWVNGMRAERDPEMEHPRRREGVASGQVPQRDAGADESGAEIAIDLAVD